MSRAGSIAVCFFSTLRLSIHAKTVPIFLCKVDYSSKKGGQRLSFKADPEIPFHTLRPTFLSKPIDPYSLFCKGSGKFNLCSIRNTSLKQTKIRIPCSPFLAGFFPIPFHKKRLSTFFFISPFRGAFFGVPTLSSSSQAPKRFLHPFSARVQAKSSSQNPTPSRLSSSPGFPQNKPSASIVPQPVLYPYKPIPL